MRHARSSRRRLIFAVVAVVAVVVLFVIRLVDIQVVQAAEYSKQAEGRRSTAITIYGTRGDIVDSSGAVLAGSVMRYDITASPRNSTVAGKYTAEDRAADIAAVAAAIGSTPAEVTSLLDDALVKNARSDYVQLASKVTLDVRNAVRALPVTWVYTQPHPARTYPRGATAGSLVGFMGTDGPQFGLERTEDSCLASTNGSSTSELSLDGVQLPGSTVVTKPAQDGGTLHLSIDSDLNWFAQQAITEQAQYLQAKWATAVVMRVSDGHLMAVADYPSVDPNDVNATDPSDIKSQAFYGAYEPGSTFKPMTAAMLIDQGVASPTTPVTVPSIFTTAGGSIQDVFAHPTEHWTTTGILAYSSNIGISELSKRLDKQKRYQYMLDFGLGKKSEVGFDGETKGLLTPADQWDNLTQYAVTFGQGVAASSIQVASIYQTLGNGGVRMPVSIVDGCEQPDGTMTDEPADQGTRVVRTSAANQVVSMLENVVTQGPASSLLTIKGYNIAAKTGTAQVPLPNGQGYGDDKVISIAGLVSGDDPQYAIVVTFGMPQTIKTSSAAAPTFTKIAQQVIKTYRITPSTKKVPQLPVTW